MTLKNAHYARHLCIAFECIEGKWFAVSSMSENYEQNFTNHGFRWHRLFHICCQIRRRKIVFELSFREGTFTLFPSCNFNNNVRIMVNPHVNMVKRIKGLIWNPYLRKLPSIYELKVCIAKCGKWKKKFQSTQTRVHIDF